jgi:uncharacterized iron-regulated membrane protein
MFGWLIQQVLGNLPSWIWPALAGGSFVINLLSGILSHLPQFKPWHLFIKPLSWVGILVGVFMFGGAGVTAIYKAQLQEAQKEIAVAQQKSSDANTSIKTKVVTRTQVIHDKQIVYQDRIKEVTKTIDADCKFDKDASKILNDAAKNPIKDAK